jgi:hypothetical protein
LDVDAGVEAAAAKRIDLIPALGLPKTVPLIRIVLGWIVDPDIPVGAVRLVAAEPGDVELQPITATLPAMHRIETVRAN